MKNLALSDTETAALIDLVKRAIVADRYLLSPRVRTLVGILGRLRPEQAREPLPGDDITRGRARVAIGDVNWAGDEV
jgi:hypothetical protein